MSNQPKVNRVIAQIRAPIPGGDPGQATEGRYTFVDGTVTLTNHTGQPVRDPQGNEYSRKVGTDDPYVIAARLTKEFYHALRGGKKKHGAGFSGPINYPKQSIA